MAEVRCVLQDLDLETARPMSPARPATPRAMPPTMAMPTSPSVEEGAVMSKAKEEWEG